MTKMNEKVEDQKEKQDELPAMIEKLADEICLKMNEIEALEDSLLELNKIKDRFTTELSEILDASGYAVGSKIELKNGRKITLKEFFTASIPSKSSIEKCKDPMKRSDMVAQKQEAFSWLDENGLSGIIKNNIVALFDRGEDNKAKEIAKLLENHEVAYTKDESVHASTLKSALKEVIEQGKNVPFNTFNVITGTKLDIK